MTFKSTTYSAIAKALWIVDGTNTITVVTVIVG